MTTKPHTFNIGDHVYDPSTMDTGKVIALCEGSQDERLYDPPKGTPIVLADDPRVSTFERGPAWLESLLSELLKTGLLIEDKTEPYPWHRYALTEAGRAMLKAAA